MLTLPNGRPTAAPHAHLIGIGGTGMRALATVLVARGWTISGSDSQSSTSPDVLRSGARIFTGHAAVQVPECAARVVYSAAIADDNPERREAARLGIATCSYPQMLAEVCSGLSTVAVAGTHGKSTVAAMATEILLHAGLDPTAVFGATPLAGGAGSRHGEGGVAIVEACEYREHFLHLRPNVAVLLNVEADHFDYYRSDSQLTAAFQRFVGLVPRDGLVIASADCAPAADIARASGRRVVTFGLSPGTDWGAGQLDHRRGRWRFDLLRGGKRVGRVALRIPGHHNIASALAAAAIGQQCGAGIEQIVSGLGRFVGLRRRLEPRWTLGGITWVDDYAHHPTEIVAALRTMREMFPKRPVWCVFQPHQASRLAALLDETAASLQNADTVAVAEVFRARESAPRRGEPTAVDLARLLRSRGVNVVDEDDAGAIAAQLAHDLRPGDALITMGAGDLSNAFHDLHCRIERHCAAA